MSEWTIKAALTAIEANGHLFQIGQLPRHVVVALNRRVTSGELVRVQARWPDFHSGTIQKTAWIASGSTMPRMVETACGRREPAGLVE
jgi:hypothetical protein